ncbi:peptide ABC transporter substrate-binding protein [Tessaracoccus defluvii]|uniref:Peptide ABC transporter substrate-binding protein n=2 Tax=Tessaracoccus defluvii TaxID=1285901 RepID=A0A7H0HAK7_9ACTN|nr:peptide ABC transporter substrate-binding protein [Tessaracoccus defluvii]
MKLGVAAVGAGAIGLTACSGEGSGGSTPTGGGTGGGGRGAQLVMGLITAPTSFDPSMAEWGNRLPFYQAVYDTLLLATPEGTIDPYLATEFTYDEPQTTLTLKIREGVTFSDGEKLDAAAVALSMNRFKDGTGPDAGYMRNVDAITAPDATTVIVTFTAPDPAFLNYLTRTAGLVMSPKAVGNEDLPTNPVGSGPYTLDVAATVTGTSYTFVAREGYWNADVQHYDKIVMRVFQDPTSMLNAVRAGELNYAKLAVADTFDQAASAGWTLNKNELDFQGLLLLDRAGTQSAPMGEVKVRQAINHAIDRPALLQAVALGFGTVTGQVFPTTSAAYDDGLDERYPYDVAKAKQLMTEAGYADGFDITMPSSTALGTTVYALIAQALGEIGIRVKHEDPGTNFIADLLAPKWSACFMALEQNPDWQLTQFMIAEDAVFNPFGYADPTVAAMLDEYRVAADDRRSEIIKELNAYIVEQAWFAPFYRVEGVVASDKATKVTMLPTNTLPNIYDVLPA